MKANELMVGDWVKVTQFGDGHFDAKYCPYDVQIKSLDAFTEYWLRFEPIPLTEEILKVNGFDKWDGESILSNEDYEITWIGTILKIQCENCSLELVTCMYVHELQHALRLCGLNDLADNFKIE